MLIENTEQKNQKIICKIKSTGSHEKVGFTVRIFKVCSHVPKWWL